MYVHINVHHGFRQKREREKKRERAAVHAQHLRFLFLTREAALLGTKNPGESPAEAACLEGSGRQQLNQPESWSHRLQMGGGSHKCYVFLGVSQNAIGVFGSPKADHLAVVSSISSSSRREIDEFQQPQV